MSKIRVISFFVALILCLSFVFAGCDIAFNTGTTESESDTSPTDKKPIEDEFVLELKDGYNQLTFYWSHKWVL